MTLTPGARLGPYEILSLVGAGGMGQVYKALDARLDRAVAVKLLPPELADRPGRRRRFEAEARAISSLNHPNICTLFDVGDVDGRAYLVMEYLEGETLEDRLTRGPLSAADVIRTGRQIADALDHAHRQHIVHRDLKPSNVMLTAAGSKLLDFGLARGPTLDGAAPGTTVSLPPDRQTAEGAIVGTFQYMAPEQIQGKEADPRSDLFAFGTLLYEMATGRKAFEATSQAGLIAAILTAQPSSISSVRPPKNDEGLPPALDWIVERCLAKEPNERWQTAGDLRAALEWSVGATPSPSQPGARRAHRATRTVVAWGAGGIAAVAIAVAAFGARSQSSPLTRFNVTLPAGTTISGTRESPRLALSPDGRHLAFVGSTAGREHLWVQSFDALTPRVLDGTDGALAPFWSPDSRYVGFFVAGEGQLKKIEASGGPALPICAAVMNGQPVWNRDGTILFSEARKGIYRVSADGGTPTPVTQLDQARREMNHFWPSMLPDGRRFLYLATGLEQDGRRGTPAVYVGSLDSDERHEVARLHSRMTYLRSGHVLYAHEGALLMQAFNLSGLRLAGAPVRIADGLDYYRSVGNAAFSVSDAGVLAHHGDAGASELVWFGRDGRVLGTVWTPRRFGAVRISPDGERAAVEVIEPRLGTADIWIYHLSRSLATRMTSDLNDENSPTWSPDGSRVIFGSDRGTGKDAASDLFVKKSDGAGEEELLRTESGFQAPDDWSADGRSLIYHDDNRETGDDLWMLSLEGNREARPLLRTQFDEWGGRLSPDSNWVAFVSNESGAPEIYVAPFLGSGPKTRISTAGGIAPRWRRDGKELFYLSADARAVLAVPTQLKPTFRAGLPGQLFEIGREIGFRRRQRNAPYDVSPDGQRFIFTIAAGERVSSRITVTLNWAAALSAQ